MWKTGDENGQHQALCETLTPKVTSAETKLDSHETRH